jgi:hypothetical protein
MKQFTAIYDNQKVTITAAGWQVGIGGFYIFFNEKNETIAVVPSSAISGNKETIK